MASYRVCLCFSDTGGGHRSAAEAIEAAIGAVAGEALPGQDVSIVLENMAEKSHPVNRWLVELYNFLLRHFQASMRYYAWLIEATKPNNSSIGYWLARKYGLESLARIEPSVVVSVHPMTNHYLARSMKELGLSGRVKLVTVITDPNAHLWSGWACPDADLIIAPNDLARDRLIAWGIKPERIKTIGMPIHPQFLKPPTLSRGDFLTLLGLDPERLTVCITAGWAGGGNLVRIYSAMARIARPVQAIFVCGHNNQLFERMKRESRKSPLPTAVLPFHDSMSDLMGACDLIVTKAGGLTTFEAIARRLPMAIDLVTEAMPQESGTSDLLIEYGLAKPVRKPADIVAIVDELAGAAWVMPDPLPAQHSLDRVEAVYKIAATILGACDPALERLLGSAGAHDAAAGGNPELRTSHRTEQLSEPD